MLIGMILGLFFGLFGMIGILAFETREDKADFAKGIFIGCIIQVAFVIYIFMFIS